MFRSCLLAGFLGAWTVGSIGGCCGPGAPPAEKFFDRFTVENTLKGFVYAVDTYQWDYAYESLSSGSREAYSQLKLEVAVRFLSAPGGVPLFDLISNALERRAAAEESGDLARVLVITKARDENGTLVHYEVYLYFVREAVGTRWEWKFDFQATANGLPSGLVEAS